MRNFVKKNICLKGRIKSGVKKCKFIQLHSPQLDLEQRHVNECVLFYSYGGVALEYFQVYIMRKNPSSHYRGRENTFSVAQSVFYVVFPVIGGMLEVPVLRVRKKTLPLLFLTSEKAQKKIAMICQICVQKSE